MDFSLCNNYNNFNIVPVINTPDLPSTFTCINKNISSIETCLLSDKYVYQNRIDLNSKGISVVKTSPCRSIKSDSFDELLEEDPIKDYESVRDSAKKEDAVFQTKVKEAFSRLLEKDFHKAWPILKYCIIGNKSLCRAEESEIFYRFLKKEPSRACEIVEYCVLDLECQNKMYENSIKYIIGLPLLAAVATKIVMSVWKPQFLIR